MKAIRALRHPIDISRGVQHRENPTPRYINEAWNRHLLDIPIRYSKRRFGIMLILATGYAPWGARIEPGFASMPWCEGRYIICCGCTMTKAEAQIFVDEGLLQDGPTDEFGRPTLVITPAGRDWLNITWNRRA